MPMLDLIINQPQVSGPVNTDAPEEQATHAASPNHYNASTGSNAKTILFALIGFVLIIYLLHLVGRAVA